MDRLGDRDAFRRLRTEGRRHRAASLSVVVRDRPDRSTPALAFAIPRKVGNAVTRNRLRRRLREVFRELERDGALTSADYLVLPSPAAARLSFGELRDQVAGIVADARPAPR